LCCHQESSDFGLKVNPGTKGFVLYFSREFVELYGTSYSNHIDAALFHHRPFAPVLRLQNDASSFLKNIAREIVRELANNASLRLEAISALLKVILINLVRHAGSRVAARDGHENSLRSRKANIVNKFYVRLEADFATNKMPRHYAEVLHVTPNYLNQIVKEISGYTVTHHIQQRVILEAKRQVLLEGHSMKEICYLLGFVDPAHFSKYFKKSCGESFSDFKKALLY
jgi:AraC family transcriptional regulator, transcriptional activator of pobA